MVSEPLMMKLSDSLESDTNQYSNRINRLKSENRAVRAGKKKSRELSVSDAFTRRNPLHKRIQMIIQLSRPFPNRPANTLRKERQNERQRGGGGDVRETAGGFNEIEGDYTCRCSSGFKRETETATIN